MSVLRIPLSKRCSTLSTPDSTPMKTVRSPTSFNDRNSASSHPVSARVLDRETEAQLPAPDLLDQLLDHARRRRVLSVMNSSSTKKMERTPCSLTSISTSSAMLRALRVRYGLPWGLSVELRNLAERAAVVTAPARGYDGMVIPLVCDGQVVPGPERAVGSGPR